jgi:hypothetical protein
LQFHGVLTGLGFKQTYADAGIYVCHQQEGDGPLFVILYVDDITILGASLQAVQRLKSDLSTCYKMSDLGEIESYLGICIMHDRSHKQLEIDQSGYLSNVLERFGMADASPHNTPLPTGADEHLKKFDGLATASDIKHYQSLIGSLLYLQIGTRPDISFAVSRLAQYTANPSPQHLRLVQYVLSYLVGTVDTCLVYDGTGGDGLHGYSDSSLGDQADDRHSVASANYGLSTQYYTDSVVVHSTCSGCSDVYDLCRSTRVLLQRYIDYVQSSSSLTVVTVDYLQSAVALL